MGGFDGSMKNIAIGCAGGPIGKKMAHTAPDNDNYKSWLKGEPFQESMVESAKATIDHCGRLMRPKCHTRLKMSKRRRI